MRDKHVSSALLVRSQYSSTNTDTCDAQIPSLKGAKNKNKQSADALTAATSEAAGERGGGGVGVEWPGDVRGLVAHLDDALPTGALKGTPLWLYGGRPKMLGRCSVYLLY